MGIFRSNVSKTKCDNACRDIASCYNPPPTKELSTKKKRTAISNSTILVNQSQIAMKEAQRNVKKEKKGKQSKTDSEGYVHKLQSLQGNFSSIKQSVDNVYRLISGKQFVDPKVEKI